MGEGPETGYVRKARERRTLRSPRRSVSAFTAALAAAKTDADVMAALWAAIDGATGDPPSPAAVAEWWRECPEAARIEADTRLRALYGPEAGDGWSPDSMETPSPRFMVSPDGVLPTLPRVLTETYGGDKHSYVTRAAYPVRVMARHWLAVRKANPDGCPAFPLAPIVRAWRDHRPRDPSRRHLHATKERHPPKGVDPLTMTRQPGVLSLVSHAPLEAVEVDGQAFVTRTLGGVATKTRRYRLADSQGDLFPGPRTLAGDATAGVIFEAVAFMLLTGDERSPLRADLLRLANLAFALSGPVRLTETEGALFVAGSDTQPNRNRFNNALWALRGLGVQVRPGTWWRMAAADPDRGNVIGPADWWRDAMTGRLKDAPAAWRFTGCLFVPASKWGAVERTISGLESALSWGSSAGRGKRGRIPDNLRPVRKGGPGPEVFVPWWQLLRLAGENVGPDTPYRGAAGVRYGRRCGDLEGAGYFTARNGTADAGGTVEVVERVRGARSRPAGLRIRATARFCAAYGTNERVSLPASRLLTARG